MAAHHCCASCSHLRSSAADGSPAAAMAPCAADAAAAPTAKRGDAVGLLVRLRTFLARHRHCGEPAGAAALVERSGNTRRAGPCAAAHSAFMAVGAERIASDEAA